MRARAVGHACLEIETSGLRLVTDPWWQGPAFASQWHQWPLPRPAGLERRVVDYVFISRERDDHLHPATLRTLRPGAAVLVPRLLSGSPARRLRDELGFCQVLEMEHGRTVRLRRGVRATCYVNFDASVLVLEDGDRVLVDANDALHEAPTAVIDHFAGLLRRRHPAVDVLVAAYSGTSWFPNCLRLPGKDDRAVARSREQLHADNFLRLAEALRPRIACATPPSFVLLDPQNRWLNEVRLQTPAPDVLWAGRHAPNGTRCHLLLPDDVVDGADVAPGANVRPTAEEYEKALRTLFAEPCAQAQRPRPLDPDALCALAGRLNARVHANRHRAGKGAPFAVELRLRENPGTALHVEVGRDAAKAALGPSRGASVRLDLSATVLDAVLRGPRGLDVLLAGHGAVATLHRAESRADLARLLWLLTTDEPGRGALLAQLRQQPLRALESLWQQRWPLALHLGTRLGVLSHPGDLLQPDETTREQPRRAA